MRVPTAAAATVALLPTLALAHFHLNNPETLGFSDDNEGKFPCGGFDISFSKTADYPVSGAPIYLTSTHPESTWLIRASLANDTSTWHNLLPVIEQSGLGDFCEKAVAVPADWAGQNGLIQVIQDATDGLLYQCAAVKFTSSGSASSTSCKNASVTAQFNTGKSISNIPSGNGSSSSNSTSNPSSSATGSAAPSSTKASAASSLAVSSIAVLLAALSWVAL